MRKTLHNSVNPVLNFIPVVRGQNQLEIKAQGDAH